MKTKLIAILLIATLLVSSAPMVLAEDNNETTEEPVIKDKRPLLRKAVPVIKQYKRDKATYQRLRDKYVERKEVFRVKKAELKDLRERLRAASSEEKEGIREEIKSKAIENIVSYLEKTISRLEALKEKGAESEKIDALIVDLQGYIAELEDTENLTRERVIEIAKEVRRKAKYLHYKGKHVAYKSLVNRLNAYVDKTEKAYERLSGAISELKEEGKDVARLENALETLRNDLSRIENALEKAEEKLEDGELNKVRIERVNKVLRAIHKRLKADILLIKKMIRHYKGLKKGQEVTEELTVETTSELEEALEELDEPEITEEVIEEPEEVADIQEAGE